jgi:hypothetical protein
MKGLFGGGKNPVRDDSFERSRAEAEARTAREKEELTARQKSDEDQRKRGLRGVRQLFSGSGGLKGFPTGQDTLGG